MKKVLILNGSPRKTGNTSAFIQSFIRGAEKNTNIIEEIQTHEIDLKYCTGCLRCNILKRCSISDDEWGNISSKIIDADILVFASPVYFHHVTAQLKKVIDRFRSFVHVQISEYGLKHTPHQAWEKHFVLLIPLGSSNDVDAQPIIELFQFITAMLGKNNQLHFLTGTRLGIANQVSKSKEELTKLYPKLGLSLDLVESDLEKNNKLIIDCKSLGYKLTT